MQWPKLLAYFFQVLKENKDKDENPAACTVLKSPYPDSATSTAQKMPYTNQDSAEDMRTNSDESGSTKYIIMNTDECGSTEETNKDTDQPCSTEESGSTEETSKDTDQPGSSEESGSTEETSKDTDQPGSTEESGSTEETSKDNYQPGSTREIKRNIDEAVFTDKMSKNIDDAGSSVPNRLYPAFSTSQKKSYTEKDFSSVQKSSFCDYGGSIVLNSLHTKEVGFNVLNRLCINQGDSLLQNSSYVAQMNKDINQDVTVQNSCPDQHVFPEITFNHIHAGTGKAAVQNISYPGQEFVPVHYTFNHNHTVLPAQESTVDFNEVLPAQNNFYSEIDQDYVQVC